MLFKVFHCTEPIDGVRYLWSDLSTECYGGDHLGTAWIAGVLLVVCNAAMPSAVAYLTWTNRHKLDDPDYRTKFGPSQFRGTPDCNESAAFAQLRPGYLTVAEAFAKC